jgi:hypothetical protein
MPCRARFMRAGATSHHAIAAKLNERNVRTARGGAWTHVQVGAILHPFAGVGSRYCTALANCSPAGGATVWRMRVNTKRCTIVVSGRHRKYECNWGGARI